MVLMKTTRTFASPCKFMKVPLHLMSCMKSLSILKHISSMKHKRRQISPTCQLPQISHIKHFTIHLDTKFQTIHPTHQVKNKKKIYFFPKMVYPPTHQPNSYASQTCSYLSKCQLYSQRGYLMKHCPLFKYIPWSHNPQPNTNNNPPYPP